MVNLIYIAGGGAIGSLLRYGMSHAVHGVFGRGFPYGTLAVNITGSLLMGLLYVLLLERLDIAPQWRAALMVGLLGAFTTFSTFSLETLNLVEAGELLRAAANILLSVSLCLLACWLGMAGGRQL